MRKPLGWEPGNYFPQAQNMLWAAPSSYNRRKSWLFSSSGTVNLLPCCWAMWKHCVSATLRERQTDTNTFKDYILMHLCAGISIAKQKTTTQNAGHSANQTTQIETETADRQTDNASTELSNRAINSLCSYNVSVASQFSKVISGSGSKSLNLQKEF